MLLDLLICVLIFFVVTFGLAWPLAVRLPLAPVEKLGATVMLSLVGVFFYGWTVYVCSLPLTAFRALPVLAALALIAEGRSLVAHFRDENVRNLIASQGIISAWCLGLLALVLSYSGGGWSSDWWGHFQRTLFFLDRGPHDILFNGFDALTSRPPLANVVNGSFLEMTHRSFTHYQLFSTLFSSLAFLPACLLAQRFGGGRTVAVLTLLFMVNPMFAQNVTYAWTKLPAAFFVLTSLYFFLRFHDDHLSPVHAVLFSVTLAAGLLTHYSAGPYAVILGVAWIWLGWRQRRLPAWRRATLVAILAGVLVLATWFVWCFSVYGFRGSLLTNTSITDKAPDAATQLQVVTLNLRDTVVPHFLRTVDFALITQKSSAGWWRDWFFQLYQVNLFFACGSLAWLAILLGLLRKIRGEARSRKIFWSAFVIGNAILCVAVHGARDTWGLAHICLQPLILLGLAFLAAQWPQLGRTWQLLLIAAATVDFILGIVLQIGVEAFAYERWFSPGRSMIEIAADYSRTTEMNFYAKTQTQWVYLGDVFIGHGAAVIGFLILLFFSALWLAGRQPAADGATKEETS